MNLKLFRRGGHARWQEQLDAYLDGELAPAAVRRFEVHLEACSACAVALETTRGLKAALASQPGLQAPRSFALTPAMAGGREPARPPRPLAVTYRLAQATAFAAIAGFATLVVVDASGGGSPAAGDDDDAGAAEIRMTSGYAPEATAEPTPSGALVPPGAGGGIVDDGEGSANAAGSTETFIDEGDETTPEDARQADPAEKGGAPSDLPAPDALAVSAPEDDEGPAGLRIVEAALAGLAGLSLAAVFVLRRRRGAWE